jgi:hypothetical protein
MVCKIEGGRAMLVVLNWVGNIGQAFEMFK